MEWRKPSACKADDPMCPEILGLNDGIVLVRSTQDPTDVVAFTRAEFKTLADGIKAGEFDDLT